MDLTKEVIALISALCVAMPTIARAVDWWKKYQTKRQPAPDSNTSKPIRKRSMMPLVEWFVDVVFAGVLIVLVSQSGPLTGPDGAYIALAVILYLTANERLRAP